MAATPTTPAPAGGPLDAIAAITSVHFVLLAVLALLAVAVIAYGAAQRRRHRAAEREERARVESLADHAKPVITAPEAEIEHTRPSLRATPADPDPAPMPPPLATTAVVARHDPVSPPAPDASALALTRIKGLGPKVQARLAELGVTCVEQLAALTENEADALDAQLGAFRGRVARDRWVEQARFLAAGDVRGFEAVFGRL